MVVDLSNSMVHESLSLPCHPCLLTHYHRYLSHCVLRRAVATTCILSFFTLSTSFPNRGVCVTLSLSPCRRHTSASNRTRMQVLVVTHERASAEETMPYASYLFNPIPVVGLYGRSYAAEPQCKAEEVVWYGWKDILLNDNRQAI